MKGLILAAGLGTRLRPLTERRSKPMVMLANRPLIHHAIDKLVEAGISEIGIVVGENEAELRNGLAYSGAQFTFIQQPEPKGLAHAVSFARDFTGKDDFVLLFCDNLFSASLHNSMAEWQKRDCECMLHVYPVPDPRACGVAVVEDGWVTELEEKPKNPKSNLAIVGIDFFTPRIYDAIARIKPSFRGELEITDAMAELIAMGHRVRAREIEGYWYDTGTFGDLLTAQAAVLEQRECAVEGTLMDSPVEGKLDLPDGSEVENSDITGPVVIGKGSIVIGSRIGPNVAIGDNCYVSKSTLADCMVYSNTSLNEITAKGAILEGELRIEVD